MRSWLVVCASLMAVAGCGGGTVSADVANELKSLLRNSEGITADRVKCDGKGELKHGDKTTCAVTVGTVTIDYEVVFVSDDRFEAVPKATVIKKVDLEKRLAEQQVAATRLEITVDCGPQPIYDAGSLTDAVCSANTSTGGYPLRITVDGATFSSAPAKPLVFKSEIEPFVGSHLVTLGIAGAKVDCGPEPVRAVDPGSMIPCPATLPDASIRTTTVTVDEAGKLTIVATT